MSKSLSKKQAIRKATEIADYLFTVSTGTAKRLVLESSAEKYESRLGGYCKEAVISAIYEKLREKVK